MVKKCLIFLLFLSLSNAYAQDKEFSIIGKWQEEAKVGSDGATNFRHEIINGNVLFFKKNNKISDRYGSKGKYYFKGEKHSGLKLKIVLNKVASYYIAYYDINDPNKLSLVPVTSNYSIICEDGCTFVYQRIETD